MDTIRIGDIIEDSDHLVKGRVTGRGFLKFGRNPLPCYAVTILTGHQKDVESVILCEDALLWDTRENYERLYT